MLDLMYLGTYRKTVLYDGISLVTLSDTFVFLPYFLASCSLWVATGFLQIPTNALCLGLRTSPFLCFDPSGQAVGGQRTLYPMCGSRGLNSESQGWHPAPSPMSCLTPTDLPCFYSRAPALASSIEGEPADVQAGKQTAKM